VAERDPRQFIPWLAGVNVVLHVVALAFSAFVILPAAQEREVFRRLDYLCDTPLYWILAWLAWLVCIPALLGFLELTRRTFAPLRRQAVIGVRIAFIGAVFDFSCDVLYVIAFPLAARCAANPTASQRATFLMMEESVALVSLVVAKGLYAVGILLLSDTLPNRLPRMVGFAVSVFGALLASTPYLWPEYAPVYCYYPPPRTEMAAGATVFTYCVWVLLVTAFVDYRDGVPCPQESSSAVMVHSARR
jgi:hypothetical protein